MVFSTFCLVLSGGALAIDRGSSSFSLVSGHSNAVSCSGVFYDIGNPSVMPGLNPGLNLGGFNVREPSAKYNVYTYTPTGLSLSVKDSEIVSVKPADVLQRCVVDVSTAASLSGSVGFALYWGSRSATSSDSGWLSGGQILPTGWTVKLYPMVGDIQEISGSGPICKFDLSSSGGISYVDILWTFSDASIFRTEPEWGINKLYLNIRSISSVRVSSPGKDSQTQEDILAGVNETNSLLGSITSVITNIWDTVSELPSKIAEAIKGLFVPSDAQMNELKASFNSLLSEKLGFVYQAVSLVDGVFDAVFDAVDNPNSDVSFTVPAFPSFDVAGTEVSLWEEPVVVDIADNQVVETVQQVASPFVVAVMVWGFVHSMEDAFLAFVGGKSLADWVRNRKEDAE